MNSRTLIIVSLLLVVSLIAGCSTSLSSIRPQPVFAADSKALTLNNHQDLADYQATLPVFSAPEAAAEITVDDSMLSSRQALADYQTTLPVVILPYAISEISGDPMLANRSALADYQASLPLFAESNPDRGIQLNDRQDLADYQATLPLFQIEVR